MRPRLKMTPGTRAVPIAMAACLALYAGAEADRVHAAEPSERPNILLIISDDIGTDVTSTMYPGLIEGLIEQYGPSGHDHPEYRSIDGRPASTPTLDRLAQEGIAFTNAWAHPFCSPTRAAILTGLFGAKTRVLSYADPLSSEHTSFVSSLRDEAGYSTALFGKWHIAGLPGNPSYPGMKPKQAGFDLFRGNLHAAIPTYWEYPYQVQDAETPDDEWREEPAPERSLDGIEATTYAPVVKAADTLDWIAEQENADPDKPWFAWLAFNLSHATSQQRPTAMAVPNVDTLDAASREEMRECGGEFGSRQVGNCTGEQLMRAMTNSLDTIVGKVLETVDELDPNTYVIYVGDNGTPMYGRPNLDFIDNMYITRTDRGKGTVYESGALVPLVIRGPNIEEGVRNDEFVHSVDLFATILNLAGLEAPQQVADHTGARALALDSVSLVPIVFNEADAVRDPNDGYVLTESLNLMKDDLRQVGARNGSHKVVCTSTASTENCEFYDIVADPLEEFPLEKPQDCAPYARDAWQPADVRWHFCRLVSVVETESFL